MASRIFDIPRPRVEVLGRSLCAFKLCGFTGLAVAVAIATLVAVRTALRGEVILLLALAAVATFLALAYLTKVFLGKERLVCYHHKVAIVAVAALLLRVLERPVLSYLDVVLLGVGTVLAFGRLGCFMLGCCHGRPWDWGVAYRHEHAVTGFPRDLVGVRLFPIQLVEALWVSGTIAVGLWLVLGASPPGEALAWYSMAYGIARFVIEFFRGDLERPVWLGSSEAQWTSGLLMSAVIALEAAGVLPVHLWHWILTGLVAVCLAASALASPNERQLFTARHFHEIARVLRAVAPATKDEDLHIANTSLGLCISTSAEAGRHRRQLALSLAGRPLSPKAAKRLATLVGRLLALPVSVVSASPRTEGLYHLRVDGEVSDAV